MNLKLLVFSVLIAIFTWGQTSASEYKENKVRNEKIRSVLFQSKPTPGGSQKKVLPTRFTVVESWSEPHAVFDVQKNMIDGIIKDLIEEVSKKLETPFELVYLSRSRIDTAVEKKLVDARCFVNESWVSNSEKYDWSSTLYNIKNIVAWKKGTSPLQKIEDLENKTLGTVMGYKYKTLDSMIASGKLKRADVSSEPINLSLLEKGRINYAVFEKVSFERQVKSKNFQGLAEHGSLQIDTIPIKCGIVKDSRVKFKDFELAIEKLRSEGFFKRLETKYGLK